MLNSPVIDLVILLSFTYFIGSLLLSTINEFIVGIFKMRQKHLQDSLENMFFEDGWQKFVKEKLINSPHMEALFEEKGGTYPAYIPAKTFVYSLIDHLDDVDFSTEKIAEIETSINANTVIPAPMKKVMVNILSKTKGNMEQFQKELETFYNDSMDRAGGWYKRKIRRNIMIIAFILATIMNIDTIKIGNDALKDKDKLGKMADNITSRLSDISSKNETISIKDSSGKVIIELASKIDTIYASNNSTSLKSPLKEIKKLEVVYQQDSGYQLGYGQDFATGFKEQWAFFDKFFLKLLGIIITVFALQLGSGFWFDVLNKAVNLRSTGKKPDDEKK